MAGLKDFQRKDYFCLEDYFPRRDLRIIFERIYRGLFSWRDLRIFSQRICRGLFSWRGFEDLLEEDL